MWRCKLVLKNALYYLRNFILTNNILTSLCLSLCSWAAWVAAEWKTGGGVQSAAERDQSAPSFGPTKQRRLYGLPVIGCAQSQQPHLWHALQLLHALVPEIAGQQSGLAAGLHVLLHYPCPVGVRTFFQLDFYILQRERKRPGSNLIMCGV